MAFVQAKCTNCGANLQVDNSREAAICPYCDSAYIVEKAINNYHIVNHIRADVVNIYGNQQQDFEIVAGKLVKYHGSSTEIVLPNNITVLGKGSLAECTYLERIVISPNLRVIEHLSFPLTPKGVITICVDSIEQWCSIDINFNIVSTCSLELSVRGTILRNLIIPQNILAIKKYTFANFRNIETVHLSKCIVVGEGAFSGCEWLTDVYLSPMTKMVGNYAFKCCKRLQRIVLPDSVTSIGSACFGSCKSLTSVSLSNNLLKIPDFAFSGCDSLQQITIPPKVQEIEHDAFYGCKSLSTVNMSHKVTIGNQAFLRTPYGEKKGCYIATAVYGSYNCPQVWTLRRFRDNFLEKTCCGRVFIRIYYTVSPTMVRRFGRTAWFGRICRRMLDYLVVKLNGYGIEDTPYDDITR